MASDDAALARLFFYDNPEYKRHPNYTKTDQLPISEVPTTPYCKETGLRHRVSPCRSAYFASPWWLLTFDLVDVVKKQLYYSQSRDGI